MTENPSPNNISKSSQYAALSAVVAEIASDKDFNGILSQKKATKLSQLCSDLISIAPIDKSSQTILSYGYSIIAKRPNVKEGIRIFSKKLAETVGAPMDKETTGDEAIKEYVTSLKESNVSLKLENVQHKNEIENLKKTVLDLTNQIQQKDGVIAQYEHMKVNPEELKRVNKLLAKSGKHIKKLEEDFENLKKENEQLKQEKDEQNHKIAGLTTEKTNNPEYNELLLKFQNSEKEKEKLLQLFEQVSYQFENQEDELSKITSARSSLVSAIHKLSNLNQILSDMVATKDSDIKDLQQKLTIMKKKEQKRQEIADREQDAIFSIIPDSIKQQIENIPLDEQNKEIIQILTNELNEANKDTNKEEAPAETYEFCDTANARYNEILLSVLSSVLRYLTSLIENEQDTQFILKKFDFQELKKSIQTQQKNIAQFMAQSNIQASDLPTLFDSLILEINPVTAKTNISSLLENYKKFETQKEEELFFLLAESISAGLALRTYSDNCKQQSKQQRDQIQQMRDDFKASKQAIELQYRNEIHDTQMKNDILNEENTKIRNELTQIKEKLLSYLEEVSGNNKVLHSILTFILDLCHLEQTISDDNNKEEEEHKEEYLEEFGDSEGIPEEEEDRKERLHNLKEIDLLHLLEEKTSELATFQEENTNLKEENEKIVKEIDELKTKDEQTSKEYVERIDTMEKSLKDAERQYVAQQTVLYDEIAQLRKRNEELTGVKPGTKAFQLQTQQIQSLNGNSPQLCEQNEKVGQLEKENKRLSEALVANQDATIEVVEKLKCKSKQMQKQLEQTLKENEEKYTTTLNDLQKQLDDAKQSNESLTTENDSLKKELSSLSTSLIEEQSQINIVRSECKLAKTNLKAMEEKMRRDMVNLETQYKLKLFASDTQFQTQLSSQKNQVKQLQQTVISTLCTIFPSIILPRNSIITEASLACSLQPISDKLSELDRTEKHNASLLREIHEVRAILNTNKTDSIVTSAKAAIQQNEKQKEKIQTLENKLQSMKKEVIQARAISEVQGLNKEWDDWGFKTLLRLGNTCSAVLSPRDVRARLSEILSASLDQKRLINNLYSLRAQKLVLLDTKYQHFKAKPIVFITKQNQNQQKGQQQFLSIRHVIQLFIAVQRIKMSPHLTHAFASSLLDLKKLQNQDNKYEDPRKQPLFQPIQHKN